MPIVTDRKQVLQVYQEAERNRWVLPCVCTENLTNTEAILAAAHAYGQEKGADDIPVTIGICAQYSHRAQSTFYTHTRRWEVGLRMFLADLGILAGKGGPYERLRVLVHLDHAQFDEDRELFSWDMSPFSSIMFDASRAPFDENIALTRRFVKEQGTHILIEGACDEIHPPDVSGNVRSELTTADKAERYVAETGVDLIVANLGTEHRASGQDQRYYGDHARAIQARVGTRIVLHGASSVSGDQLAHLIDDGISKVNLWTALERDSSPILFKAMLENASRVAGRPAALALQQAQLLGPRAAIADKASLEFFTTTYRQHLVFEAQRDLVLSFLRLWYR
jgi:fructose-bisphosphate aldolase class II